MVFGCWSGLFVSLLVLKDFVTFIFMFYTSIDPVSVQEYTAA